LSFGTADFPFRAARLHRIARPSAGRSVLATAMASVVAHPPPHTAVQIRRIIWKICNFQALPRIPDEAMKISNQQLSFSALSPSACWPHTARPARPMWKAASASIKPINYRDAAEEYICHAYHPASKKFTKIGSWFND